MKKKEYKDNQGDFHKEYSEWKGYKGETELHNRQSKDKVKCKVCGHTQLLGNRDRVICKWCKNYIYKDEKTEFMYNLGKAIADNKKG